MKTNITPVLAGLTVTLAAATSVADEQWEAKFRREAPEAWKALEQIPARIDVAFDITTTGVGPDGQETSSRDSYRILGLEDKRIVEITRSDGSEMVYGRNENGYFTLERASDQSDYALNYIGSDPSRFDLYYKMEAAPLTVGFPSHLSFTPYREFFDNEKVRVEAVTPVTDSGKQFVRVDFKYRFDQNDKLPIDSGAIRFDPDNLWATVDMDLTLPRGERIAITPIYGAPIDGLPSLEKVTQTVRAPGTLGQQSDPVQTMVSRISKWERPDLSDERFRISAYGLPEIDRTPIANKSGKSHYWWIAAGVVFAVLAVGSHVARRVAG
jgi:hypothetical protein